MDCANEIGGFGSSVIVGKILITNGDEAKPRLCYTFQGSACDIIFDILFIAFVAEFQRFNGKFATSAKCGHKLIDKINSLGINECLLI